MRFFAGRLLSRFSLINLVVCVSTAFSYSLSHLHTLSLHAHITSSGLNILQPWRSRPLVLSALTTELLELIPTSPSQQPSDLNPGRGAYTHVLLPSAPVRRTHTPPPAAMSLPPDPAGALLALLPSTLALVQHHGLLTSPGACRASAALAVLLHSLSAPVCAAELCGMSGLKTGPSAMNLSWLIPFARRADGHRASLVRFWRRTRSRTCCLRRRRHRRCRRPARCRFAGRATARGGRLPWCTPALRLSARTQRVWSLPRRGLLPPDTPGLSAPRGRRCCLLCRCDTASRTPRRTRRGRTSTCTRATSVLPRGSCACRRARWTGERTSRLAARGRRCGIFAGGLDWDSRCLCRGMRWGRAGCLWRRSWMRRLLSGGGESCVEWSVSWRGGGRRLRRVRLCLRRWRERSRRRRRDGRESLLFWRGR